MKRSWPKYQRDKIIEARKMLPIFRHLTRALSFSYKLCFSTNFFKLNNHKDDYEHKSLN